MPYLDNLMDIIRGTYYVHVNEKSTKEKQFLSNVCNHSILSFHIKTAVRHESCNGLYKLSLSGLDGGDSINRSFLLLAASTLLKFLPDAQALKPIRVRI